MEFIIGKDKFPLIKFDSDKYAHIFPVTKYQFERYIWEKAPNINYDEMLQANPRKSPDEINKKNIRSIFINNISFNEATKFADYLGGRLPTIAEIKDIYTLANEVKLKDLLQAIPTDIDARGLMLFKKIFYIIPESKIVDVFAIGGIDELCSNMPERPYRPIYSRHVMGGLSHLVGVDACETRVENAGFRVIVKSE